MLDSDERMGDASIVPIAGPGRALRHEWDRLPTPISGFVPRKRRRTTVRLPGVRVASDLLERDFRPQAPSQTWSAGITYVSTWEGFLYLAHVQDLYSRLIVGWSMADHLRSELVVDALEMALHRRRPERGLVHHSDSGAEDRLSSGSRAAPQALKGRTAQAGPSCSTVQNRLADRTSTTKVKTYRLNRGRPTQHRPRGMLSLRPMTLERRCDVDGVFSAVRSERA
jgi:transposase InsO family protein